MKFVVWYCSCSPVFVTYKGCGLFCQLQHMSIIFLDREFRLIDEDVLTHLEINWTQMAMSCMCMWWLYHAFTVCNIVLFDYTIPWFSLWVATAPVAYGHGHSDQGLKLTCPCFTAWHRVEVNILMYLWVHSCCWWSTVNEICYKLSPSLLEDPFSPFSLPPPPPPTPPPPTLSKKLCGMLQFFTVLTW